MPLTAVNFVPLTGNIKAADLHQFFDLFTGAMTDQPVTFANTLTVGGSQGAGAAPFRIGGVAAQTANMVEVRKLAADAQPEFVIGPTGTLAWGPGGAVGTDVSLARSAANQLTLTGLAGTPALVIPVGGLQVAAGGVGIGTLDSRFGLRIDVATSGAGQQGGIIALATSSNTATASMDGVWSQPATAAAAFICPILADFHAYNPIRGAGSTVTTAAGLMVELISAGQTNNYGVFITMPTGAATSNIGLQIGAGGATFNAGLFVNSVDSVHGTGSIANGATTGFLYLPLGGGNPSGVPSGPATSWTPVRMNAADNKMYAYINGSWKASPAFV